MPCVIAIDAGTSGVRSVAVDHRGEVVGQAHRPLTTYYPQPGWVEHDPEEIWASVQTTLHEVAEGLAPGLRPVVAIGITNQRETVVAWDRRSGAPLHRALVWQDRRTAERCEALTQQGHLDTVRAKTGLVLDPYFSATKMQWLLDQAGLRSSSHLADLALGTVDSWVLWRLTGGPHGGVFATDATNASRTLLYDIVEQCWSEELCHLFSVPPHVLAPVLPSCGRLGLVDSSAVDPRSALGGTPVSGIAGDQHAALFGQACFQPGMAKVTYGTGSFVLLTLGPRPPEPPEGLVVTTAWDLGRHGGDQPVTYALEGSAFNSGAAIQWLRDGLGIIASSNEAGPLAASVATSEGLAMVPAFTGLGSPWWDPDARGTIVGITRGSTRAHLTRAVVEAMTFEVRAMVEAMTQESGRALSVLRADGGAAAMDLLLQLQADHLGVPVARSRTTETTALGAATLAGLAEGLWANTEELAALWRPGGEFQPSVEPQVAQAARAPWARAVERARGWHSH